MNKPEYSARYYAKYPERVKASGERYRAANLVLVRTRQRSHHRRRVAEWRAFADALKLAVGCADCGYNAHAEALDFDHRPGEVKSFNVSKGYQYAEAIALAEVAKCEVVCANCHRVRTAQRRGSK